MMKQTIAPRAEMKPRTLLAVFVPAVLIAIAACQGEPEPLPDDDLLASDGLSLSTARDPSDPGAVDPGSCGAVGCASGTMGGSSGANADVNAGGTSRPRGLFAIVRPLVSRVVATSARTVRGLIDVADALPAAALAGVRTCRAEVVTCLDTATTDLDIGVCADSLDGCVDGVVDIIDPVLDPLPGPNGSGIAAATQVCRGNARDCLAGALSLNDIGVCGDVLGACVDGIDIIVDGAVDDVNDIIDPLAVPKPDELVDCTLQLTKCLADLQNPFDCAEQARICASQ